MMIIICSLSLSSNWDEMGWDDGIEWTSIGPKGSSDAALQLDGINQSTKDPPTHMYKGGVKKGARKIRVCLTHTH